MKTSLAVAALATAALMPVHAKQKQPPQSQTYQGQIPAPQPGFYGTPVGPVSPGYRPLPSANYGTPGDPTSVYWGPQFIGRDPDPNVQRSLLQQYFETHGR